MGVRARGSQPGRLRRKRKHAFLHSVVGRDTYVNSWLDLRPLRGERHGRWRAWLEGERRGINSERGLGIVILFQGDGSDGVAEVSEGRRVHARRCTHVPSPLLSIGFGRSSVWVGVRGLGRCGCCRDEVFYVQATTQDADRSFVENMMGGGTRK